MAISFCHAFLLWAGVDPKPSKKHHKMKLCESIHFQIGKINFFIWHFPLEVTKTYHELQKPFNWNQYIPVKHFSLDETAKFCGKNHKHPKHFVKFWQDIVSFQRSLRVNGLIQAVCFSFFFLIGLFCHKDIFLKIYHSFQPSDTSVHLALPARWYKKWQAWNKMSDWKLSWTKMSVRLTSDC